MCAKFLTIVSLQSSDWCDTQNLVLKLFFCPECPSPLLACLRLSLEQTLCSPPSISRSIVIHKTLSENYISNLSLLFLAKESISGHIRLIFKK